jgi:hypothetical protein
MPPAEKFESKKCLSTVPGKVKSEHQSDLKDLQAIYIWTCYITNSFRKNVLKIVAPEPRL